MSPDDQPRSSENGESVRFSPSDIFREDHTKPALETMEGALKITHVTRDNVSDEIRVYLALEPNSKLSFYDVSVRFGILSTFIRKEVNLILVKTSTLK